MPETASIVGSTASKRLAHEAGSEYGLWRAWSATAAGLLVTASVSSLRRVQRRPMSREAGGHAWRDRRADARASSRAAHGRTDRPFVRHPGPQPQFGHRTSRRTRLSAGPPSGGATDQALRVR